MRRTRRSRRTAVAGLDRLAGPPAVDGRTLASWCRRASGTRSLQFVSVRTAGRSCVRVAPQHVPTGRTIFGQPENAPDSGNKLLVTGFRCSLGSRHQGSDVAQRPAPPGVTQGSQSYVLHRRGHRRHHPRRTDAAPPPPLKRAPRRAQRHRSRKARAAKRPGLMARRPGAGSETTKAQARDSRPDLGLRGWSG